VTSTEIVVIVIGVLVGYWGISRLLGRARPPDEDRSQGSRPD
jgi:hypothetical protein